MQQKEAASSAFVLFPTIFFGEENSLQFNFDAWKF